MSIKDDTDSTDRTPWDTLTHERQRLLKAIAFLRGDDPFERPQLQDDIRESDEIEDVVDDKDGVLKSVNSTALLNRVEEDGYLRQTYQGGESPIVLDLGYEEDRDKKEVAPFGQVSALHKIVDQVFDREDIVTGLPDHVDDTDFNAVISAVNAEVGRTILVIVSEPSKYRFTEEALEVVSEEV